MSDTATITPSLADRFAWLERCTVAGLPDHWDDARRAVAAVHNAADGVVASLAVEGWHFPMNGQFRELQGALYGALLEANPRSRPGLLISEIYGMSATPAGTDQ